MTKTLESPSPPKLTDLLNAVKANLKSSLNCVQVGIIQEFNATNQTASIELALKKVLSIEADGTRIYAERPKLLACPCVTLFGGASFLSMPIAAGDSCLVLFNDQEIDNWYEKGGVQPTSTFRRHDLSDAIAIVGIRSLQNSIVGYLTDGVRLAFDENCHIDLLSGLINIFTVMMTLNGSMQITGDLSVTGTSSAAVIQSGNGATGTFTTVTVVDGIVTGGS